MRARDRILSFRDVGVPSSLTDFKGLVPAGTFVQTHEDQQNLSLVVTLDKDRRQIKFSIPFYQLSKATREGDLNWLLENYIFHAEETLTTTDHEEQEISEQPTGHL